MRERICAPVAELVDARDSKSRSCMGVSVRFGPGAPFISLLDIVAANLAYIKKTAPNGRRF